MRLKLCHGCSKKNTAEKIAGNLGNKQAVCTGPSEVAGFFSALRKTREKRIIFALQAITGFY